jgi:hypothetical protein
MKLLAAVLSGCARDRLCLTPGQAMVLDSWALLAAVQLHKHQPHYPLRKCHWHGLGAGVQLVALNSAAGKAAACRRLLRCECHMAAWL